MARQPKPTKHRERPVCELCGEESHSHSMLDLTPGTPLEEIVIHFARHFGEPETHVLHEIESELVHLDVHVIPPSSDRQYWTLFTTGMSDLPMTVPDDFDPEDHRYAELMVLLPEEWPVYELMAPPVTPSVKPYWWPIDALISVARYPHRAATWLGFGHSLPNGVPPEPLGANTRLCGWLLVSPPFVPKEAWRLSLLDGRMVNFFCLHALHLSEMNYKIEHGPEALLRATTASGVTPILNPGRAPCRLPRSRYEALVDTPRRRRRLV